MTELQKLGGVRIVSSVDGIELKPPTLQEQEKPFQPYAEELGRLVFAWNRLHANLGRLFWVVTGISSERMPLAIWHSTPSDLSQRRMLRAAVETFGEKEQKRKDILWLLDKLDRSLSHNRNEAVHAPLVFFTGLFESNISQTRIAPDTHSGSPLASRLSEKGDLLQEFKYYRDYAACLSDYVLALFTCLRVRDHGQPNWPWPDRPCLPNRNPPKARKASSRRQKKS
jgi:hypothetical protein